ncbi:hypothetical protein B0T17DRAFT_505415 [Bombardia bombarda]|uniref:DUF4185 domain-containing protein n=1 Tax=Bombardia bombarda TaxID=252184 RepID=A0AA39X8P1_9PEZI|nr:hypothetical protein B0T17DRAFT_505415 [Bombardia bombarda]
MLFQTTSNLLTAAFLSFLAATSSSFHHPPPSSFPPHRPPQNPPHTPPGIPALDNTQPVGTNPISVSSVQRLGFQVANNSCSHRDLGFTGQIAGEWYAVFGDTLWCDTGVTNMAADTPGFHGMVRDAVSLLTDDPLTVVDLNLNNDHPVPHQLQFIPFNPAWGENNTYGFGGTSLCETDARTATAAIYYLVKNGNTSGLIGAGVGKVQVIHGTPTVTQRLGEKGYWWDAKTTPRYGDICAYRDEKSGFIYIWGGPPIYVTDWLNSSYVYLARVKAADAFELSRYQYYWGPRQGWRPQVLTLFTPEAAAMWGTGQGQVVWNAYYGCYVFVHLGIGGGTVYLRTAHALEGPWTPDVQVYTATPIDGGLVYAGVAHPYLDTTGRTLVISYTNNNHIEVIKVVFK